MVQLEFYENVEYQLEERRDLKIRGYGVQAKTFALVDLLYDAICITVTVRYLNY